MATVDPNAFLKAENLIALAQHHANLKPGWGADCGLYDARSLLEGGRHADAQAAALRSLEHSIGILHADYLAAKAAVSFSEVPQYSDACPDCDSPLDQKCAPSCPANGPTPRAGTCWRDGAAGPLDVDGLCAHCAATVRIHGARSKRSGQPIPEAVVRMFIAQRRPLAAACAECGSAIERRTDGTKVWCACDVWLPSDSCWRSKWLPREGAA